MAKRVLLAEDDAIVRRVMVSAIERTGAEVIESVDGGRMLVALTAQYRDGLTPAGVDLVVTDVQMPVVDGLELFKGLRNAGWMTPVLVVTGYDTPEVRDVVRRFDAELLWKPLDLEVFEATVTRLLACPRAFFHRGLHH